MFKVEPKTSWRHANAFVIKLHNLLLVKVVQLFLFYLLNYEIVEKSKINTLKKNLVQMKQIK